VPVVCALLGRMDTGKGFIAHPSMIGGLEDAAQKASATDKGRTWSVDSESNTGEHVVSTW
jgi:hypothetical protein